MRQALPHASGLSRRQFLTRTVTAIAGAAAASTLDLEKLLWSPGEKTIIIPPFAGIPDDTLVGLDWFMAETLRLLKNNLSVASHVHRKYADCFATGGGRMGDTVRVPLPVRFDPQPEDEPIDWFAPITQAVLPVTLDRQYGVEIDREAMRRCRSLDDVRRAYVRPAAEVLAHVIEHKQLDVFADLSLPVVADKALLVRQEDAGLALRGIEHAVFDHTTGEVHRRFRIDFLAGSSGGQL